MRVIITGASGVLGSAVFSAFSQSGEHEVLGLAHSRSTKDLHALDLSDHSKVTEEFTKFKPNWVIHCAAERRPDVAQKDPKAARELNVNVTAHLASLSKSLDFTLIYISTDYVFDGTSPPYSTSSATNPLNLYGVTKRDGELAVLDKTTGANAVVIRLPVLYGPAPKNSDSAINILLDVVQDQSGKRYSMDHYATRYPTNVVDIASFLLRLTAIKSLPPVIHYSSAEPFTKYEICLVFSKILGLEHKHIIYDADPPKDAATRPKDTKLDTSETERLLPDGSLGCAGFEEWWTEYLCKSK